MRRNQVRAAILASLCVLWGHCLAADLEPTLGKKGRLLPTEDFDGDTLPKSWSVKSGAVQVAGGTLHTSQRKEKESQINVSINKEVFRPNRDRL